jgi:hypothetical protein
MVSNTRLFRVRDTTLPQSIDRISYAGQSVEQQYHDPIGGVYYSFAVMRI